MARASLILIDALRKTATNLTNDKPYEWGHMGSCNCGNLAQVLLNMPKADIHRYAMEKTGDWSEQLNDYCPTSGLQMDQLIFSLLEKGFSTTDLHELEYLKNEQVLNSIGVKHLQHNKREDVIIYLKAWADVLEDEWLKETKMPLIAATNQTVLL
jgi:hypothetical protein